MRSILGLAVAGVVGAACGHATTTGSAQNDWATPTGHASATNPRYVNPMAAAHPARDRSVFATREASPLQAESTYGTAVVPETTAPQPTATPVSPEIQGPTAPDVAAPAPAPRVDELPPGAPAQCPPDTQ